MTQVKGDLKLNCIKQMLKYKSVNSDFFLLRGILHSG